MARNVAIKVSINGTDQAVSNLEELEAAVEKLRNELKSVEIGSDQFKQLSGELQNAESQLKTLNKSFEGLEPQQKAEAFVKLGEGIAGSFAIATAALTAFGVESEEVEEAQLAVTQALTAAIGFRQIAEAGLQLQVVATTVAQKAYNLAASAGNKITKLFYTTIAANPIGAIVTAVAALAAGIYALVQSMEEQISVQEQMNDALATAEQNTVKQELALTSLKSIIDDTTKSDEVRNKALTELKGLLPELETLTLDQEDAIQQINTAYERNIKLIQERAKAEVLSQLIIDKTKELIETQNSELEDNISFWEKAGNYLRFGYNPIQAEVANVVTGVNNKVEKQNELQEEINDITEQYTKLLDGLLVLETEQDEVLEETNKQKERSAKADKARVEAAKELQRVQREAIQEELKLRKEVISITQSAVPTTKIIQDLTNELNTLKGVIAETLTPEQTLQNRIDEIFSIPEERIDEFGKLFFDFFPELSKQLIGGLGGFDDVADATLDTLAESFVAGDITKEAFDAGVDLLNNYKKLYAEFEKQPEFFSQAFNTEIFFKTVKDLKVASGAITTDAKRINGELVIQTAETEKSLSQATANVGTFIQTAIARYVQLGLKNEEEIEKSKKLGETQEEFAKRLEEEAQVRVNNIIKLSDSIIDTEQAVESVALTSIQLIEQINDLTDEGRAAVFISESSNIIQQAGIELKERQRGLGLLKSEVESFEQFRIRSAEQIAKLIPQFEQLSRDEQLEIIKQYYEDLKKERDKNKEDEKTGISETIQGISDGLQQVAQVAQTGVQVFQQYVQTQLTLLQEQEERILEQIVGDSEEAEQKRLEVQQEYEARRKEITKQGQIAQLELTRLQAVANVAEAITKAFAEGPLIGQVLAAITAGLGAIQVGVITNQLSQVRSLARGGLLVGPSHENNGIPLAGGGVIAEGGEAVINRRGSIDYRGLLNEVSMSSGGAPMVNSSFDDTRLIEAITKTNRTPIKAFVLEQDITSSQSVNKRLQQLSKI